MPKKKKNPPPKKFDPIRSIWCSECMFTNSPEYWVDAISYDGEFVLMECLECGHRWWSDQNYAFVLYLMNKG